MNNQFRKIIVVFLIIVLEGSYKPSYSSNAIVVKVGKNIVTSYEIENKIKRMIFFSNQELNQENVNNTKMIALKLLIETKLMLQELDKYNFDINKVNYNDSSNTATGNVLLTDKDIMDENMYLFGDNINDIEENEEDDNNDLFV